MIDHLPIEIGLPRFAIARGKARSHLEEEILRNHNLEHIDYRQSHSCFIASRESKGQNKLRDLYI